MKKSILLFFSGLLLLTGFFLLPFNRDYAGTVLSYWKDFQQQRGLLDRETRMKKRFHNEYVFSKAIATLFENRGNKANVLVLMPPSNYFSSKGIKYHVPEPAVFYYYTGLKTVWANSREAINAGWYVRISNGEFLLDSVTDKRSFQDTIHVFQKYGVTL